ncbi:MAG TPA: hypothetical protein VGL61_28325 [Kofleriaceae bacterium]|jgi:hypothetical protein
MRAPIVATALVLFACTSKSPSDPMTFSFGPFDLAASQEISTLCVQISLNNDSDLYINSIHIDTGPGFHHSNWFWVPEHVFAGPNGIADPQADDGTYTCSDRGFDEAIAAIYGGVLFAQSTQDQNETQAFLPGMAIHIPPKSKIVAQIHLLNPGDAALHITPTITLGPIAAKSVTTNLHGISFENQSLALPPMAQSKFTLDCDLNAADASPPGNWPLPSFNIYYALAHYHALGTGLEIDALMADDTTSTPVFTTSAGIGDALGGPVDPPFAMAPNTRFKFSCSYYNDTTNVIPWGLGSDEMCVFLAFTDSPYNWGGGVTSPDAAGDPTIVNGVQEFTHPCTAYASTGN